MNGCTLCGGWAGRHDPIAHDAEPQEDTVPEPTDELRGLLAEHAIGAFAGSDTACACDHRWRTNIAYREHLAEVVTAWAEQHARERAAEVVTQALRILDDYGQGGTYAADYIRALAVDDRPDPGRC